MSRVRNQKSYLGKVYFQKEEREREREEEIV